MSDFIIVTDSSADLDARIVEELDIHVLPLTFTMHDLTYQNHPDNRDMDPRVFYDMLRKGESATTSAVNVAQYIDYIEPLLEAGNDVLIMSFSSGLSATYSSSVIAADALRSKYPDRKILTVDTLCASLGQGLLVCLAAKERAAGKTIEEVHNWAVSHKLNICHQVTVDDLQTLKRGGRISSTTAFMGSMLQIKPVIHVDNEGHLVSVGKARGRQAALKTLVDRMEQTAIDPRDQTVFICHGDCIEDAELVAQMVTDRFGVQNVYINYVGPVIGSHTGPGVVGLFYVGVER